jgi:hypothetical protein
MVASWIARIAKLLSRWQTPFVHAKHGYENAAREGG